MYSTLTHFPFLFLFGSLCRLHSVSHIQFSSFDFDCFAINQKFHAPTFFGKFLLYQNEIQKICFILHSANANEINWPYKIEPVEKIRLSNRSFSLSHGNFIAQYPRTKPFNSKSSHSMNLWTFIFQDINIPLFIFFPVFSWAALPLFEQRKSSRKNI